MIILGKRTVQIDWKTVKTMDDTPHLQYSMMILHANMIIFQHVYMIDQSGVWIGREEVHDRFRIDGIPI